MPTLNIKIGRRNFDLVCGQGQEEHLNKLAADVSSHIEELSQSMDSNNDTLLLVMSALMMQDKLNNISQSSDVNHSPSIESVVGISQAEHEQAVNIAVADAVSAIAKYVQTVADRVEDV